MKTQLRQNILPQEVGLLWRKTKMRTQKRRKNSLRKEVDLLFQCVITIKHGCSFLASTAATAHLGTSLLPIKGRRLRRKLKQLQTAEW